MSLRIKKKILLSTNEWSKNLNQPQIFKVSIFEYFIGMKMWDFWCFLNQLWIFGQSFKMMLVENYLNSRLGDSISAQTLQWLWINGTTRIQIRCDKFIQPQHLSEFIHRCLFYDYALVDFQFLNYNNIILSISLVIFSFESLILLNLLFGILICCIIR